MAGKKRSGKIGQYMGIDVGGTKIQASLVQEAGGVVSSEREPTPQDGGPERVVEAIEKIIETVLHHQGLTADDLAGIGIAIPGVVDPDEGRIVITPNMSLSGVSIGPHLQERFDAPVALGNDCNLGALGEAWLGSARAARSMMSILVGTGIGSGVVHDGELWRGARESAGEIGHIVMEIGGPQCGCGNLGCFEAMASRRAIERDIRQAVDDGRTTVLTDMVEGELGLLRSSLLRRALDADDELVIEVMRRASEVLGHACLTVRHLLDPEVIVLGGGVVEACSEFMLPIVEEIVEADKLSGDARDTACVKLSALGDDAVVLGAVALATRDHAGRNPFDERFAVTPNYPTITDVQFGEITIGGNTLNRDVMIRVSGQVKKRKKSIAKDHHGSGHVLGPKELRRVCRGGPEVLFVGSGHSGKLSLHEEGERYLAQRSIECHVLPTPEVVKAYNDCKKRKAALVHVTC